MGEAVRPFPFRLYSRALFFDSGENLKGVSFVKLQSEKLNWGLISKYRAQVMGIAILWVMLYHAKISGFSFPGVAEWVNLLMQRGNNGVDMFLFLSGVGLYFSYTKESVPSSFYKKRLIRVVLPYLIIGGLFWGLLDLILRRNPIRFLKDLFLISFWKDGTLRMWFIGLILLLYLAFPVIYRLFFCKKTGVIFRVACTVGCVVLANALIACNVPDWYNKVEIALTRIPVFLIGVYAGVRIYEKRRMTAGEIFFLVIWWGLARVLDENSAGYVYTRYLYMIQAILLCIFLAEILQFTDEKRGFRTVNRILVWCGKNSLELYIYHIWIRYFINKIIDHPWGWLYTAVYMTLSIVLVLVTGILKQRIFFRKSGK